MYSMDGYVRHWIDIENWTWPSPKLSLTYLGTTINFTGHVITPDRYRPDNKKYEAIRKFPQPQSQMELRAFLSLVQQLVEFVLEISHMSSYLQSLLKRGATWTWLPEHEVTFNNMKKTLVSKTMVKRFKEELPIILMTDTSWLHHNLCNSFSMSPSQSPVW